MSRLKLKNYIKEQGLDVSVKPRMSNEDIVEAVIKELEPKEEKTESKAECPGGGTFGKDLDELSYCNECPDETWKACSRRAEELDED